MNRPEYYAHSADPIDHDKWHRLAAHLEDTAARAASFLEAVSCGDIGRAAGLLHDVGKYTGEFQTRLQGGPRVDHSTAGAKIAVARFGTKLGRILAFCIAGHHAGLANGVNGVRTTALTDRLNGTTLKLDPVWEQEITLPELTVPPIKPRDNKTAFSAAFFTRMLFSALVDADYLDTEAYFASLKGSLPARGQHPKLGDLLARLESHLARLASEADITEVNRLRREVLNHVRRKASSPQGLFTLTVPTGGGKTLTSLAFALEHAVRHGFTSVIYVIPFTSIVDQTASVFRDALRNDDDDPGSFLVEHHSAFDEDLIGNREAKDKLRLSMENWDAPIIVTTAVQFFESLFANRPSRCRKLHNIANSVVILDEAQTLPLKLLRPCVTALDELARNWQSSIVLCTATQPSLSASDGFPGGFEGLQELAPDPKHLYRKLKRTRICQRGKMDDARLAEQLRQSPQALCIVNTRRHARELYEIIESADGACHLTTAMCARHRSEVLKDVRLRLKGGEPVLLVATSLVEAGVDIDFPVVWRAEAGLESIVQAAGRCNREGRASVADVFVFEPAEAEGRKPPAEIAQFAAAARGVMRHHNDPLSLEAIKNYFQEVYWIKDGELDAKGILHKLDERGHSLDFPFESIAKEFRMIETDMVPVIVPYRGADSKDDTVARLLSKLDWVEHPGWIARDLQPYVVQIPLRARSALLASGAVRIVRKEVFAEQFFVLTNSDLYLKSVGLTWEDPTFRRAESLVI